VIQVASQSRITAADLAASALSRRAMTVSLSLSAWGAQRLDRTATKKYTRSNQMADDAAKVHKLLVPKDALDPVTKAHGRASDRHRNLTLPWGDKSRILSAAAYFDYSQAMAEERANCEAAHRGFVAVYPDLVTSAPNRLGQQYCASDFPSADVIARKFGFKLSVMPVPHGDDFRLILGDEIEAEIRRDIEETVKRRGSEAQRDLWTRLLTTVRHFASTMAEEKRTFQRTTVTNLAEIATIAPKLSLDPDPELERICAEILAITDSCDAESLRASTKLRGRAAEEATAALRQIETAMQGAF